MSNNLVEVSGRPNYRCPNCQAEGSVEGGEWDSDGTTATQESSCVECAATWNDRYRLVGLSDLQWDDGPLDNLDESNRVWLQADSSKHADWQTGYACWRSDLTTITRIRQLADACGEMGLSMAKFPLATLTCPVSWGPSSDEETARDKLTFHECVLEGGGFHFTAQSGHGVIKTELLSIDVLSSVIEGRGRDIFLMDYRRKAELIELIRNCGELNLPENV